MENTEEQSIDVEDIGAILKSSRLKQKKTMEEISSELCIRKIYLTALEEGDYVTLPPVPYGAGYVRTYARYLGLNAERAVKLYKSAAEMDTAEKEASLSTEAVPDANKSNALHIVLGIIAVLAVYGAWQLYEASELTAPVEIQEEVIAEDQIAAEETAANEAAVEVILETENSDNEIKAPVVEEGSSEGEVLEEIPVVETPAEPVEVVAPEIVNNSVVVEFKGETWVELRDKKKVYFQGVFHEGDKKEIDYVDNLFLSVGRPGNVTVYVKGVEKDILVKKRKMNIPLDSLN